MNYDTINLQREIKHSLVSLNWSKSKFCGKYMVDTNDHDIDEAEINNFYERFKKHLSRKTTSENILTTYLDYIKQTPEYLKQLKRSPKPLNFAQLHGDVSDYSIIMSESTHYQKVLAVAAAYALAIGTAYRFYVLPLINDIEEEFYYNDPSYLVFWDGDIGCLGGSGTSGPHMCEVWQGAGKRLYVNTTNTVSYFGFRSLDEVVGIENNTLTLIGFDYAANDSNCCPSLRYKTILIRNETDQWSLSERSLIDDGTTK